MLRSIISVLVVVVLAAAGGYWWLNRNAGGPGAPGAAAPPSFPMPVEAQAVRVGTAQRQVQAIGTLRSNESVMLRPLVAGRVTETNIAEGQVVRRGEVLVQLDYTVERAELAQAEAQNALARANFDRAQDLAARGVGTQRALDEARASLRQVEASMQLMRARLQRLTLEAPFDGVLGLRRVSVGDYVAPGAELVNIEMIDPLKLDFRVPEIFVAAVRAGQAVQVLVDAFPNRQFQGRVLAIDPAIDSSGRAIVVRAVVANEDRALRPGLFARVNLTLAERENAIFVPEAAIVPQGERATVFRVVEGRAQPAPVVIGQRSRGEVEVREGLNPGDVVIVSGQMRLGPGTAVAVVPQAAPAAPPAAGQPTRPPAQPAPPAAQPAAQPAGRAP